MTDIATKPEGTNLRGPRLSNEAKAILEALGLPTTGARANKSLDAVRQLEGVDMPVWIKPTGRKDVPPALQEAKVPITVIDIPIGKESIRKAIEQVRPDLNIVAYLGGLLLTPA